MSTQDIARDRLQKASEQIGQLGTKAQRRLAAMKPPPKPKSSKAGSRRPFSPRDHVIEQWLDDALIRALCVLFPENYVTISTNQPEPEQYALSVLLRRSEVMKELEKLHLRQQLSARKQPTCPLIQQLVTARVKRAYLSAMETRARFGPPVLARWAEKTAEGWSLTLAWPAEAPKARKHERVSTLLSQGLMARASVPSTAGFVDPTTEPTAEDLDSPVLRVVTNVFAHRQSHKSG